MLSFNDSKEISLLLLTIKPNLIVIQHLLMLRFLKNKYKK